MSDKKTDNIKILMIVAYRNFRDEEYFIPLDIFRRKGFEVITASSKTGAALGVLGGEAEAEIDIKEVKAADFDAVIFAGGSGAQEYFENETAHGLARDFNDAGKIVGAICIAPVILAKAGILKNQTAAVWQSPLDKTGPKALAEGRCKFSEQAVEQSGNIITANSREASEEFALKIVEDLAKRRY